MMTKDEEKPVLGYQRSEYYYQTEPHFHQMQFMQHPAYVEPHYGYPSNPSMQQPYQYYEYSYPARPLPYVSPDVDQGFSFGRVMLCLMMFLVTFTSIISLLTYMIFMTLKPQFYLESFVVSTFNISGNGGPGTTLKANWETKMSVRNMNHRSSIEVKHAETMLMYRYMVLDTSTVDHILDAFSFPNSKQSINLESLVSDISKDRQRGQIIFDLELEVLFVIKSNVFQKNEKLRYFCERIIMNFQNGSSNIPTWTGPRIECVAGL
ncbi:unnamed protein product [Withania somnifera]